MTSKHCCSFGERLVDFADGELSAAERRRVATHLTSCADCRAELQQLERSLELAKAEWRQAALPAATQTALAIRRRWPAIAARAAACIACLLAASAFWPSRPKPGAGAVKIAVRSRPAARREMTEAEVNDYISRQTRAARLAVAAKILASQPGLEDYAANAKRYLSSVSDGKN